MTDQPQNDRRLWEALEACRPQREDLSDPALAELAARLSVDSRWQEAFERMQDIDGRIEQSMPQVPTPEGLQDRLLARLAEAQQAQGSQSIATPRCRAAANAEPLGDSGRSVCKSRRWLFAAGAVLSTSAVLLVVAWLGQHRAVPLTQALVQEAAIQFFLSESGDVMGHPLAEQAPPAAYPFSREVVAVAQARWRPVEGLLDRDGLAYDLNPGGRVRATLYVVRVRQDVAELGSTPPWPPFSTAGCAMAAWQEGDLLYMLVVRGQTRTYRHLLAAPQGPLA